MSGDLSTIGLHRQQRAALSRLAVKVNCARAARRGVATAVRAGQHCHITDEMHQQQPRGHIARMHLAIDCDTDGICSHVGLTPVC